MPNTILTVVPLLMLIYKYSQLIRILTFLPERHDRCLLSHRVSTKRRDTENHLLCRVFYPSHSCPVRVFLRVTGMHRCANAYPLRSLVEDTVPLRTETFDRSKILPAHVQIHPVFLRQSRHLFFQNDKRIPLYHLHPCCINRISGKIILHPVCHKQFAYLNRNRLYPFHFLMMGIQHIIPDSPFTLPDGHYRSRSLSGFHRLRLGKVHSHIFITY